MEVIMKYVVLSFLVGGLAQAGSTVCTDFPGHSLKYEFFQPDGGAHIVPTETLAYRGEILVNKNPQGLGEVQKASIRIDEKLKRIGLNFLSLDKNYEITAFIAKATIREIAGDEEKQALLFEGVVSCERKVYIGRPRP